LKVHTYLEPGSTSENNYSQKSTELAQRLSQLEDFMQRKQNAKRNKNECKTKLCKLKFKSPFLRQLPFCWLSF